MSTDTSPLALIVGGSLGGLIAAHQLKRIGWRVRICERVTDDLSGRGAGLATHPELVHALAHVGIRIDARLGIPVSRRSFIDADGAQRLNCEIPQVLTSWNRLFTLLREPLADEEYRKGQRLVDAETDAQGRVQARFHDGSIETADLLIGADGLRSTVRGLCDAQAQPQYAGYVAWRGRLPARRLQEAGAGELLDRFTITMRAGAQFIGYPVPGTDDDGQGSVDYNWLWYRPCDEVHGLPALCTDEAGICHGTSIPPPLLRPALLQSLRDEALATLPGLPASAVRSTPAPFFQAIFDLSSRHLVARRVALIGDAAFVARPHCGMGVTKAAGDALALADALAAHPGDLQRALAKYETERLRVGRLLVAHARHLGSLLEAGGEGAAPPLDVMTEVLTTTAVPPAALQAPS